LPPKNQAVLAAITPEIPIIISLVCAAIVLY
jgi:hypothetical protein